MDGACEGWTGMVIGSVGATLGRGESSETLVLLVLLTCLLGLNRLALSDCGLADGPGWMQGMDPALERARDRASIDLESDGSLGQPIRALFGSLGLFREHGAHSGL
jgi:hypothetical protein